MEKSMSTMSNGAELKLLRHPVGALYELRQNGRNTLTSRREQGFAGTP